MGTKQLAPILADWVSSLAGASSKLVPVAAAGDLGSIWTRGKPQRAAACFLAQLTGKA